MTHEFADSVNSSPSVGSSSGESQQKQRRLAFLTAGAAGMYCGSCMHDNSLARALIELKQWDVQLIPTYTPIRTDEQSVTVDQVFFGGINLYLQQKIPLFRHIPQFLDRFLDSPWLIRRLTAKASETSRELLGQLTVSMLKGMHGNQRKEVQRLVGWLQRDVKPEALLLTNILIAGFVPYLKQQLDIPVAVMLQGDDIFLESLPEKYREQALQEIRRIGQQVDAVVYHSQFYADKMNAWFDLAPEKTHITPLTIDTADFQSVGQQETEESPEASAQLPGTRQVRLGYMARIAPEKGLHLLVDAFIQLKRNDSSEAARSAHLSIAGWLGDHRKSYLAEQQQKLDDAGLGSHYTLLGTVEREQKIELLNSLDVFCVPSPYKDPKGLYLLEAMAAGIPSVMPAHGAFPELVEPAECGLLFEPDNVEHLARCLSQLIEDSALAKRMGSAGREYVNRHRNRQVMAEDAATVFEKLWRSAAVE